LLNQPFKKHRLVAPEGSEMIRRHLIEQAGASDQDQTIKIKMLLFSRAGYGIGLQRNRLKN
jgi:hypothetical protein